MLTGCGLPQAWRQQQAWRILDSDFGRGLQFFRTLQAWKNTPLRPRLLHYVALSLAPPSMDELLADLAGDPELREPAQELLPQWTGLLPGFHRLSFQSGQVLLTLCVGESMAMLREQQFFADSVFLRAAGTGPAGAQPWSIWSVKALARCCHRGTRLTVAADAPVVQADLIQCGFEIQALPNDTPSGSYQAEFNPRWTIKTSRQHSISHPVAIGSCAVIGAGLAGASVAAALARRGWRVQVLDQGAEPALGASGLPVGLVVPHVSADDCTLSRLSRAGVRMMLQQARSLLRQGQDWELSGTRERQLDGAPDLPDIWHPQAAWLKPGQLVQRWLAQPGVTFQGNARVADLRQKQNQWELLDALGQPLACVDRVVLANAGGALPLLARVQASLPALGIRPEQLPTLHGVRGQLSWAMHDGNQEDLFPPHPVNGSGSVIPTIPMGSGSAWFVGSTYQPDRLTPLPDERNHQSNLQRLLRLCPTLGQTLAKRFAEGGVQAWKNTRCVSADRLPVVGPLYQADNPSLWLCAAMGSRGLSFSVLCAELLAAQWGGEPMPVDAGLVRALQAFRGESPRIK